MKKLFKVKLFKVYISGDHVINYKNNRLYKSNGSCFLIFQLRSPVDYDHILFCFCLHFMLHLRDVLVSSTLLSNA